MNTVADWFIIIILATAVGAVGLAATVLFRAWWLWWRLLITFAAAGLTAAVLFGALFLWLILTALCAFVRDGTRTETGNSPPTTEIQAALTVIGRRGIGQGFPDLSHAHIPKANLYMADLELATLTGAEQSRAFLKDANLTGADLTGANLIGTDLTGAKLKGAMYNSSTKFPDGFNPSQERMDLRMDLR